MRKVEYDGAVFHVQRSQLRVLLQRSSIDSVQSAYSEFTEFLQVVSGHPTLRNRLHRLQTRRDYVDCTVAVQIPRQSKGKGEVSVTDYQDCHTWKTLHGAQHTSSAYFPLTRTHTQTLRYAFVPVTYVTQPYGDEKEKVKRREGYRRERKCLPRSPYRSNARKLVGVSLGTRFREVVQLQTVPTPRADSRELLVRTRYAGINASDINWTAGRYMPGIQPPFDTGFRRSRTGGRGGETLHGISDGGRCLVHATWLVQRIHRRPIPSSDPRSSRGPLVSLPPRQRVHGLHSSGEGGGR